MEKSPGASRTQGFCRSVIRWWFTLTRRKIRLLQAADVVWEGPALLAVSHPADFLHALVLATAVERPVHCLLPKSLARGLLAGFFSRHLGMILFEGERPDTGATLGESLDLLAAGEALAVFAGHNVAELAAPGTLASTAAKLLWRAEVQLAGRQVAVYPVYLFLPEPASTSREILIYVDSALAGLEFRAPEPSREAVTQALGTALESRFQDNAFRLRPADLDYFLADLEVILRTGLQEDWESCPEWKQDAEGFVLSRLATERMKQTNNLDPARVVTLRKLSGDYRRLQRQRALRQFEVEGGDSPLGSGWRRAGLWVEALLGLPIALYGLLNHLGIAWVLFLTGSFKKESPRARSKEWALRGGVMLGFYALQVLLVGHWRGRAAAGYYAPTLPVSGAYLWRYVGLVRPQARLLFISLTIPGLTRKIKRLRNVLQEELDRTLASYEEKTSVTR